MDLTFAPSRPWELTSLQLTEVLDQSWKAKKDAEPRRQYLGGSIVGRDCEREIAYQYHAVPKENDGFSGQLYRIFDRGHQGEDRMANYLRVAGFELVTHRQDGSQFGWSAAGGKIKGHIDGCLLGGPLPMPYPALWENKILNNKSWGDLQSKGMKKSKPVYYTQVNLYMAYMELPACLFTAENADNCQVHAEIVMLDREHAQAMSDRALRIVQSQAPEELPRCATTETDYRCRMCDFAKRCWSAPAITTEPTTAKPAWLT